MSIFRNTVWFVKGMREYTGSGYQAAAKHFKPEDLEVDCSGKSYMITGDYCYQLQIRIVVDPRAIDSGGLGDQYLFWTQTSPESKKSVT